MKFGAFDQNDASGLALPEQYEARLKLIELYDRSGFDVYHMSEHHGTPLSLTPSPSVFLAAVAQRTKRLRFGPLVYLLPLYNPMRLVEEICMLDGLSGGRFEFGIGRGASPHELRFMGVNPEEALSIYKEVYEIVIQGLTGQRLDYEGKHWRFKDAPLAVAPVQRPHPPLWYAAASAESAVWPARLGYHGIAAGPLERVKSVAAAFKAARRPTPDGAESAQLIGLNRYVIIADSDREARSLAKQAWTSHYQSFSKLWRELGGKPVNANLPETVEPLIENGAAIVGSPATVRSILSDQLRQTGVNFFSGTFVLGALPAEAARYSIGLFVSEVMPDLREIDLAS